MTYKKIVSLHYTFKKMRGVQYVNVNIAEPDFSNSTAKVRQMGWTNKDKRVQCWAKDNYSVQTCPKGSNYSSFSRLKLHFRMSLSTFHRTNLLTRIAYLRHDTDGYLR